MVGSHHQLNRREFEQTQGDSEGQGSLAGYSPWGHKELGHNLATEQEQRIIFISKVFVYSKQKQVFNSIFKIKLLKDIFIFS